MLQNFYEVVTIVDFKQILVRFISAAVPRQGVVKETTRLDAIYYEDSGRDIFLLLLLATCCPISTTFELV